MHHYLDNNQQHLYNWHSTVNQTIILHLLYNNNFIIIRYIILIVISNIYYIIIIFQLHCINYMYLILVL